MCIRDRPRSEQGLVILRPAEVGDHASHEVVAAQAEPGTPLVATPHGRANLDARADNADALARRTPHRDQVLGTVRRIRHENGGAAGGPTPRRIARAPERAHVLLLPDARRSAG